MNSFDCPRCGTHVNPAVTPGGAEGRCPRCGPLPTAGSATSGFGPALDSAVGEAVEGGRVPGYEIEAELGRGAMGVVYRARQAGLDRLVALKMILVAEHAGPVHLARFRTEAEAVARLQHPNIVQVFEVGEHEGRPFFSMEFCPGGSLKEQLAGTPRPPREAAGLIETLARAMHAAHQAHVVHRDLKPANVLLAADGTPKVADFGLAKKLEDEGQTQSGAIVGTPSYMAPEQAGGRSKEVGPAADVYALGALLYECLTGRPPFKADTVMDTLLQVLNDEPVPPRRLNPKVPADLETVCLKCLEKDPVRRYAGCRELADDLGRFQAGEPIAARPAGALERAAKWARRRPAVAALLALVAFLATTGFGLVTWQWLRAAAEKRAATRATEDAETKLVDGLLRPISRDRGPLNAAEVEALWEVTRLSEGQVRRFFERGLATRATAVGLGRRAREVARAAVGLDRGRRDLVRAMLLARLRDEEADRVVREACVALGVGLEFSDEEFAEAAVPVLLRAMKEVDDPYALAELAETALAAGVSPKEAGAAAARAIEVLAKFAEEDWNETAAVEGAVAALAARMGPEEAGAAASPLLEAMVKSVLPAKKWDHGRKLHEEARLVRGVGALAAGMGPKDAGAATAVLRRVREGNPKEGTASPVLRMAEAALAMRLGPQEAGAAATGLLEVLGGTTGEARAAELAQAVEALAVRLGPQEAAAVAARGLALMGGRPPNQAALARAMGALVTRLGPEEARATAAAAASRAVEVMGKDALGLSGVALVQAVAALAGRLGPEEAAAAASRAPEAMVKVRDPYAAVALAQAVAALAARMRPGEAAAVAARVLKVAPKADTPGEPSALDWVIPVLGPWLRPNEAEAAAAAAAAFARALKAMDRTITLHAVIEPGELRALVALAASLGPKEAAAAAARLLEAMGEGREPLARAAPALAVAVLAGRMGPQGARATAAAAAARVLEAMGKAKDPDDFRPEGADVLERALLARAVAALAARLGPRDGRAAAAAAARALEGLPKGKGAGEVAALALARAALAPHLGPQGTAAAAARALEVMAEAETLGEAEELVNALATLAPHLAPEEAAAAAAGVLAAVGKGTRGHDLEGPQNPAAPVADAVAALAARLGPEEARATAARALEAMARATGPQRRVLAKAVTALIRRMSKQGLVDTLKVPFYTGAARDAVLRAPEKHGDRKFTSVWDVTDWAPQAAPEIDLLSPPGRTR